MGEAELRAKQRTAVFESMLGDVKPYNAHLDTGCPKCGGVSTTVPRSLPMLGFNKTYCFGAQKLNPDNRCPVLGEHLHVFCSCGHGWLEHPKDWTPNESPLAI